MIDENRINAAIDLLTAMIAEEIGKNENRDSVDVLPEFLASRTAAILYDEETKLWWDGPSSIVEDYYKERNNLR